MGPSWAWPGSSRRRQPDATPERPEQGAWWSQTQKLFDGEVSFQDCTEVETHLFEDVDDARFVHVVQGRARDKDRVNQLYEEVLE